MSGLSISCARLLALPTFLISAVGAKATSNEFFGFEHVDGTNNDPLELWLESAKCEVAPKTKAQKIGRSSFLIK